MGPDLPWQNLSSNLLTKELSALVSLACVPIYLRELSVSGYGLIGVSNGGAVPTRPDTGRPPFQTGANGRSQVIKIDLVEGWVSTDECGHERTFPLTSREAFSLVSKAWVRAGWDTKYMYSFTWLGRPIIQLPEDMIRIQEVIWHIKPDVLIETGVAHGGSLVFYASLFKSIGRGRVIGIDVEIRPHNRRAIEEHELHPLITLIEGNSIDTSTVAEVRTLIQPDERIMVVLDSKHTKDHVLAELAGYSPLVSVGSYAVVEDGYMEAMSGAPRSQPDWSWNNPKAAVAEFVAKNPAFEIDELVFPFNEGVVTERVTLWPNAYLKRKF
jgi:cephalosporin hydroxylase